MTQVSARPRSRPTGPLQWATGVELVQTSIDSLHIVGDIEQSTALTGAGERCVDWLRAIDGQRDFAAESGLAGTFGVEGHRADAILTHLVDVGALTTGEVVGAVDVDTRVVLGDGPLACRTADVLGPGTVVRSVPRPSEASDWRSLIEEAADQCKGGFVVVALERSFADAIEVELGRQLVSAQVDHLVVGAGVHTARVGPLVDGTVSCLECEHSARERVEPEWRRITSQLGYDAKSAPNPSLELSALAAAEGSRQVAAFLAGYRPSSLGSIMETGYRGGTWRHRPVTRNHQCECWWPR